MSIIKNPEPRKREINLLGTEGNAYFLLGTAREWGKQLDLDVDKIEEEMESSDYENLIKVFDKYFGNIVDLVYRG
jgi:hypothetical protein|tara:strand:- start:348 stop:572 length:225 start_codon:yes stop_codon:yes gene_type:complete